MGLQGLLKWMSCVLGYISSARVHLPLPGWSLSLCGLSSYPGTAGLSWASVRAPRHWFCHQSCLHLPRTEKQSMNAAVNLAFWALHFVFLCWLLSLVSEFIWIMICRLSRMHVPSPHQCNGDSGWTNLYTSQCRCLTCIGSACGFQSRKRISVQLFLAESGREWVFKYLLYRRQTNDWKLKLSRAPPPPQIRPYKHGILTGEHYNVRKLCSWQMFQCKCLGMDGKLTHSWKPTYSSALYIMHHLCPKCGIILKGYNFLLSKSTLIWMSKIPI